MSKWLSSIAKIVKSKIEKNKIMATGNLSAEKLNIVMFNGL